MSLGLSRRTGFEIELLAPPGASRHTLAVALAEQVSGEIAPVWHQDSEPSLVPRLGHFLHLTQGFEVRRARGDVLCTLVDDVTIVAELDSHAAASPGWHRILTDDARLLRLLAHHSDPAGSLETSLDDTAALWGTAAEQLGNIVRLESDGATVALATVAGGERERPCEIVTPPLATDHQAAIDELLRCARELDFTVPIEAAVHLHVDGAPFRDPAVLANVIRLFAYWREPLRLALGTNVRCARLAPLPQELVAAAETPTTERLRAAAKTSGLSKFFDVNLTQLLRDDPIRDTLEVRILPGSIDAATVVTQAAIVERLLDRCLDPVAFPLPPADPREAVDQLLN